MTAFPQMMALNSIAKGSNKWPHKRRPLNARLFSRKMAAHHKTGRMKVVKLVPSTLLKDKCLLSSSRWLIQSDGTSRSLILTSFKRGEAYLTVMLTILAL